MLGSANDLKLTGIGLASLISQLDSTASDIVNHQKDALLERKDVAQKTKEFRKLDDAAKLTEYKALLKCEHMIPWFMICLTRKQRIKALLTS